MFQIGAKGFTYSSVEISKQGVKYFVVFKAYGFSYYSVIFSKGFAKNFVVCNVFSQERRFFEVRFWPTAIKMPQNYGNFLRYAIIKVSQRLKLITHLHILFCNFGGKLLKNI
ncbi:hypothetical protein M0802_015903 [Mischocyttarus mexicanus]|nr:hypothetical protein M0802_015903 [Mischocyttarus mexicanus]